MQFHSTRVRPERARARRLAVRRVWAGLGSERLVRMFEGLIVIAATRPEKLKTFELAIRLATKPEPARATINEAATSISSKRA